MTHAVRALARVHRGPPDRVVEERQPAPVVIRVEVDAGVERDPERPAGLPARGPRQQRAPEIGAAAEGLGGRPVPELTRAQPVALCRDRGPGDREREWRGSETRHRPLDRLAAGLRVVFPRKDCGAWRRLCRASHGAAGGGGPGSPWGGGRGGWALGAPPCWGGAGDTPPYVP